MNYGDDGVAGVPEKAAAHKAADLFQEMCSRLMDSVTKNFNGAFLIVPPQGEAKDLILYSGQNAAVFWSLLKTTAEMALNDLAIEEQQNQSFNRR